MHRALSAIVRGMVQGVAFRYHTRRAAEGLGLVGYVRNLPDGTVEVWAEGGEGGLRELDAWLRHGPPSARVERVDSSWKDVTGAHATFEITF
jgi:acylphosphatase